MDKNKKQAIEWLKASHDDLDSIKYLIEAEHLTNVVAFHAQQAIEKSFKALFEYKKIPFIKTHNLEKLYKKIEDIIDVEYEELECINELYIESRYPGDMGLLPYGKPTLNDAQEFYEFAKRVSNKVCAILNVSKEDIFYNE